MASFIPSRDLPIQARNSYVEGQVKRIVNMVELNKESLVAANSADTAKLAYFEFWRLINAPSHVNKEYRKLSFEGKTSKKVSIKKAIDCVLSPEYTINESNVDTAHRNASLDFVNKCINGDITGKSEFMLDAEIDYANLACAIEELAKDLDKLFIEKSETQSHPPADVAVDENRLKLKCCFCRKGICNRKNENFIHTEIGSRNIKK